MDELYVEAEAADDQFLIDYDKLKLNGVELGLDFNEGAINVYLLPTGANDKQIIDQLEDNGNEFYSNKHDTGLGDDLLDIYLKQLDEASTGRG